MLSFCLYSENCFILTFLSINLLFSKVRKIRQLKFPMVVYEKFDNLTFTNVLFFFFSYTMKEGQQVLSKSDICNGIIIPLNSIIGFCFSNFKKSFLNCLSSLSVLGLPKNCSNTLSPFINTLILSFPFSYRKHNTLRYLVFL